MTQITSAKCVEFFGTGCGAETAAYLTLICRPTIASDCKDHNTERVISNGPAIGAP